MSFINHRGVWAGEIPVWAFVLSALRGAQTPRSSCLDCCRCLRLRRKHKPDVNNLLRGYCCTVDSMYNTQYNVDSKGVKMRIKFLCVFNRCKTWLMCSSSRLWGNVAVFGFTLEYWGVVLFTEKNSVQETARSTLQDQRCLGFPAKSHAGLHQKGIKVNYIIFHQLERGWWFSNGGGGKWRDERC